MIARLITQVRLLLLSPLLLPQSKYGYDEDHEGGGGWFGLGRKEDRGMMRKGRPLSEELYDKMGNIKDDLSYKAKYAADQASDVGYGITNKMRSD